MKKIMIVIASAAALGLGFWFLSGPKDQSGLANVRISQVGTEKHLMYLPLYVAMEEGIFEKNGLRVRLSFAGNDNQVVAAVIGGSADFGMGDPVFSAIAQERGGRVKTVALMITKLIIFGFTNNNNIGEIASPVDLDGLRIGSWPAPSTMYTQLAQIRKDYGLNLEIVEGAFNAQLALLEARRVDIALGLEPSVSLLEEKGYRAVLNLANFTDPQAITGLTTTERLIERNPELVQKVVNSMQQAHTLLLRDREAGIRTAKKLFPDLSHEIINNAIDRILQNEAYPVSVEVKGTYWQRSLQSRLDSGELKNPQPTEVAVDNSFAEQAFKKYVDNSFAERAFEQYGR
ncbi:MAG: ABC transporter substrate-binding protein [Alphaproteobacteria bacterium]|nr:ABC transporter substrate-binding protein [Alphaproteobacteria bacterium]